jgi:hypothetical protein
MQTVDLVQATWNAARGAVEGSLQPQSYGRRIVLMAIQGPGRSTLTGYQGYIPEAAGRLFRVFPADSRTYDANELGGPIKIRPGEAATFQWTGGNSGVGQTASCNIVSEVYD